MELVENFLEDWPESLDIFGSVWMDALDISRAVEDWSPCLFLVENLFLELLNHQDLLLETRVVCFNILGPMYSDDPFMWMFTNS